MRRDGTRLRLLVGAATAVLLHLLIVPTAARLLVGPLPQARRQVAPAQPPPQPDNPLDQPEQEQEEEKSPAEPPIVLGHDDAPQTFSVAWIAWDDFQDMVGRESRTHQPALQQQVDPVPNAPVVVDATPPAPTAPMPTAPLTQPALPLLEPSESEPTEPSAPSQTDLPPQPSPIQPMEAPLPMDEQLPMQQDAASLPAMLDPQPAQDAPADDPQAQQLPELIQSPQDSPPGPPGPPSPPNSPTPPTPPNEQQPPEASPESSADQQSAQEPATSGAADVTPQPSEQPPQTAAAPADAAPTSAPRDESESDPAQPTPPANEVRPGRVITTRGIEITTARPQFSVVARTTALPSNPLARISFDKAGRVIAAELLQRTGYSDIDGAVLASLYRWRAGGKELEKRNDGFSIEIRIILLE